MTAPVSSHPILSCAAARVWETRLLGGDEAREWAAMRAAGGALAAAIERDFAEVGAWPGTGRHLVLAGKGHNGGDALLAAQGLLERHPGHAVDVVFVQGERVLRPLAARAWQALLAGCGARVRVLRPEAEDSGAEGVAVGRDGYLVVLDGIYGFQFRPPLDGRSLEAIRWANTRRAAMRVAVDLPSGLSEAGAFHADWTYATGILKEPLLECANAGRVRYLDLGFFDGAAACAEAGPGPWDAGGLRVATEEALAGLAGWREPESDKRTHGHVAVIGGSRRYPGAALMAVQAALRSGAGLVTAFVPEALVTAGAARLPEAIWVGWPETPEGGLALEGLALWREAAGRFAATLIGPGLGREPETLALACELPRHGGGAFVVDADALQPAVVEAVARSGLPCIFTPHAGELARIASASEGVRAATALAARTGAVVTAKGPSTRIHYRDTECLVCAGGPVLARGGSGDLLAGLTAGLLAQAPGDAFGAAVRGALWHGRAADALARSRGAAAVQITQLLDYLPEALPGR